MFSRRLPPNPVVNALSRRLAALQASGYHEAAIIAAYNATVDAEGLPLDEWRSF